MTSVAARPGTTATRARPASTPLLDAARSLLAAFDRERPSPGPLHAQLAAADQAITACWASARVCSLDIFDTALVRVLQTPRDVFLFVPQLPPLAGLGLRPEAFAAARIAAERDARLAAHQQRGSSEVTLGEIATVLARSLGQQVSAADLVAAERAIERAACRPNPWALDLHRRAIADGKQTWFLSDTYHEAAFLRELLEGAGYVGADLIVSSAEERHSKGAGELFRVVLARTQQTPRNVLHIGDHPLSDGRRAREAGLQAVVHPLKASTDAPSLSPTPATALALGLGRVVARASGRAEDYWWRFGAETAGPVLAGFALWLAGRLHADRVQHAYFLLRDGEILARVFDALTTGWQGLPTWSLLPSSRRAFALPAFESNDGSVTSQLFVGAADKPVRTLLERFGVPVRGLDAAAARHGLGSLDTVITVNGPQDLQRLVAFVNDHEVRPRLLAQAREERTLLTAFLDEAGVFGRRIGLVDIGWNGTIQKALRKVARLERRLLDAHGYYLGTRPRIDTPDEPGMPSAGYLFDRGAPAAHQDGIFACREVIEFICSSTRGSLLGFRRTAGRIEAVEAEPEHVGGQGRALAATHDGIMAYVTVLRNTLGQFGVFDLPATAVIAPLVRTLTAPTAEDAEQLGGIQHGEGVGTDAARALARWPDGVRDLDALESTCQRAYWPTGLLALHEPRSLAVRLARWHREGLRHG